MVCSGVWPSLARAGAAHSHCGHSRHAAGPHPHAAHGAEAHVAHAADAHAAAGHRWNDIKEGLLTSLKIG